MWQAHHDDVGDVVVVVVDDVDQHRWLGSWTRRAAWAYQNNAEKRTRWRVEGPSHRARTALHCTTLHGSQRSVSSAAVSTTGVFPAVFPAVGRTGFRKSSLLSDRETVWVWIRVRGQQGRGRDWGRDWDRGWGRLNVIDNRRTQIIHVGALDLATRVVLIERIIWE